MAKRLVYNKSTKVFATKVLTEDQVRLVSVEEIYTCGNSGKLMEYIEFSAPKLYKVLLGLNIMCEFKQRTHAHKCNILVVNYNIPKNLLDQESLTAFYSSRLPEKIKASMTKTQGLLISKSGTDKSIYDAFGLGNYTDDYIYLDFNPLTKPRIRPDDPTSDDGRYIIKPRFSIHTSSESKRIEARTCTFEK